MNETQVSENELEQRIGVDLSGQADGSVVLRADQSVPVQYIVAVIDAVNKINDRNNTKHKVILATRSK